MPDGSMTCGGRDEGVATMTSLVSGGRSCQLPLTEHLTNTQFLVTLDKLLAGDETSVPVYVSAQRRCP